MNLSREMLHRLEPADYDKHADLKTRVANSANVYLKQA
jgi:hypothetical protein